MTDQLRITEDGRIVSQPVTWDGEPLYSEDSVREGLFDRSAFEQLAGQIAMSTWDPPCGRKVCADRECCAGRVDCPCGMADES